MIDHANELRRYSRKIGHPAGDVPSVMLAAADEIERLAAMLEAAEKSRDDLLACLGEWLDKTKWVQQGSNEGTISAKYIGLHRADVMARLLDEAEKERDALRAKVEQMERQKPVGKFTQHPSNGLWEQDGYGDNPEASPLYALPGAQGE